MDGTLVEQTRMRAGIARRMVESKQQAPHFYVQTEVSVGPLQDRLAALNEGAEERTTMTVALVRASVAALRGHPRLNVVWTAAALRDLVERARSQRLRPAELSEATFTLSNLGMFEVSAFTAIVTPPQVAILATGRPVERWTGA